MTWTRLTLTCRRALGLLTCLTGVIGAACHGYLAVPAARNVQRNSDYCPHCLNGPGVCGDPRGSRRHETGGSHATPPVIAATYRAGDRLTARVTITANHKGRWSLGLCTRLPERTSCFKMLKLADGRGSHVYLPSSASSSSATFRLPRGVTCSRCVLRWHYETGNSCTPRGTPRRYASPGLDVCGKWMHGETFTNCADIRIKGGRRHAA